MKIKFVGRTSLNEKTISAHFEIEGEGAFRLLWKQIDHSEMATQQVKVMFKGSVPKGQKLTKESLNNSDYEVLEAHYKAPYELTGAGFSDGLSEDSKNRISQAVSGGDDEENPELELYLLMLGLFFPQPVWVAIP